ncbi:MAG: PAS domain S-box protein, partial [Anaerolineae bacterium]|nr:PAS domain S-box protein [Anaerolineae bacterium]
MPTSPKKAPSNHHPHALESSRPELDQQVRELEETNRQLEAQVAALQQEQMRWQLNEAILRESEVRLQILANLVPSMVWTASPDGAMTYANDRWLNYVGLTPEQNARQWPDRILHPSDRDRCLSQWTHALQTGADYEIEARHRRHDGVYRWFLTRAVPLRNAEGHLTAWLGASIDIHDRKVAERKLRESETELRLIMDTVPGLMAHIDRDQRYQFVNAAYERWYNLSHQQIIGRSIREIIGSEAYEQLRPGIEAALAGEQVSFETTITYAEGDKTVLSTYVPHLDIDGQPSGFYALVMDISARKQAELAQRLLAETGKVLASSLDYTVRLSNVAHLAVPHLADWCAVDIFEDDGSIHHIAVAHIDPAKVALARQLQQRYPPRPDVIKEKARPWLRGQAELYPEITEAILRESAQDAEHYQILRDLRLQSAMVVPLMVQERVVGMMLFVWAESGYRYSEQDLALAEELARRAAIALENARTYQAEQAARQTAEQIAERIASLQTVTTRLSQAVRSAQIAEIVLTHGLATMGINAGLIALLTDEGTEFELLASIGYLEETMTRWQRFPAQSGIPMADVVQSGQPLYVNSRPMAQALYPVVVSETSHAAWAVMPLVVEGRTIGGLSFSFPEAHEFSPEEREFGLTLAYQCAQALER